MRRSDILFFTVVVINLIFLWVAMVYVQNHKDYVPNFFLCNFWLVLTPLALLKAFYPKSKIVD